MKHSGATATTYVEVYDEPDHESVLVNEFVHAYRVRLRPQCTTLWHRHAQDTVYFSLNHARAGEEFPSAAAIVTDVPCGAAVSRPHHREPLIHKVTNHGAEPFHLIGAEAHRRPAAAAVALIETADHHEVFQAERFRVYRIQTDSEAEVAYPGCGLMVALSVADVGVDTATRSFQPGDLAWLNDNSVIRYPSGFRGFFAQWL